MSAISMQISGVSRSVEISDARDVVGTVFAAKRASTSVGLALGGCCLAGADFLVARRASTAFTWCRCVPLRGGDVYLHSLREHAFLWRRSPRPGGLSAPSLLERLVLGASICCLTVLVSHSGAYRRGTSSRRCSAVSIRATARSGSSCSQMRTTTQPAFSNRVVVSVSRRRVVSIFARHHVPLCSGTVPCSGHPCQKQPSQKTATFCRPNTRSARRLRSASGAASTR
jgi:hypothetical protein